MMTRMVGAAFARHRLGRSSRGLSTCVPPIIREFVPVTLSGIGKKPIACALESDRVNVPANHGAQQAVGQRLSALPRVCSPIARHIAQPIDIHKEAGRR